MRYRILCHYAMKTTLDINDLLLAEAKALAAQQRTSLTRLIEEGLRLRLRASGTSARQASPSGIQGTRGAWRLGSIR